MAILKCKMCGGDLVVEQGITVAECEYCGTRQTVPKADDEKKLTLFGRAGRLRAACDFDKAASIYESIIASFPAEAEAYWGLVLCKYGIEYVDDPATGKKIPTCHRSSFDSVLEDVNFEQAMENSDMVAQLVYREEAKQLEQLRKQILSVSSSETPYDIFICYKETDEYGNRTVDSVLAQDLYAALTDKGYRVFFARVSLQEKLGQAYEPYIFSALQSSRVMLAVGSRYEYYTAVWVKNEWSRFLQLCQQDKNKHLIPCYKNLPAEDMPKEFQHLQGADLGKMGAIQDILFNIEKYLPLRKPGVVREQVIINEVSQKKLASLLDRGHMALEDGDFSSANGFFEEVLNNDSKNAPAYLGKFLVSQRCASLAAYEAKCLQQAHTAGPTRCRLAPDEDHIARAIERYGTLFASKYDLKKLYQYDLQYTSHVPQLRKVEQAALLCWEQDKNLSKAVQFSDSVFAAELEQAKARLSASLTQVIDAAAGQEQADLNALKNRYALHLDAVDKQVAEYHTAEQAVLEERYHALMAKQEQETSQRGLRNLAEEFSKLGSFLDSPEQAQACRGKAAEIDYQAGLAQLQKAVSEQDYRNVGQLFATLRDYKDSADLTQRCNEQAEDIRQQRLWKQEQELQRRKNLTAANHALAKKLMLLLIAGGGLLFVLGCLGLCRAMIADDLEIVGAIIGSVMLQLLICVLPAVCCLVQILLLGKKDKASTAFRILTFIVSGLGIFVWGIVLIVMLATTHDGNFILWSLCSALLNGLCLSLSILRKRKI